MRWMKRLMFVVWVSGLARSSAAEPLLLPHFTFKQGQWATTVTLQNPTSLLQICKVTAFDNQGNPVGQAEWRLPAGGALHGPLNELIEILGAETGWLRVQRDSAQIGGTMTFSATASGGSTSLPFAAERGTHLTFPLLLNDENWASGVVLLNPDSVSASITLTINALDGSPLAQRGLTLAPGQKLVAMSRDLVTETLPARTMVYLSSDQPLQAFGLRFAADLAQIVAVPARVWAPGLMPRLQTAVAAVPLDNRVTGFSLGVQTASSEAAVAAAGLADRDNARAMTTADAVRVGSLAKSFTAALVFLLVEDGLLRLDDPVATWWPDFPRGDEITVEMLLRHRSGLADLYVDGITASNPFVQAVLASFDQDIRWSYEEVIAFSVQQGFRFEPGTRGEYANVGYTLLAWILERVSGQTLAELLETRLFEPLSLHQTYLLEHPREGIRAARAYLRDDEGWLGAQGAFVAIDGRLNMAFTHGAGGLASTPQDLMTWGRALLGGRVLKPASLAQMLTTQPMTAASGGPAYLYGCGLYALDGQGRPVTQAGAMTGFGHAGATWGGSAFMYVDRNGQNSVALVSNQFFGDNSAVKAAGFALLQEALAKTQRTARR